MALANLTEGQYNELVQDVQGNSSTAGTSTGLSTPTPAGISGTLGDESYNPEPELQAATTIIWDDEGAEDTQETQEIDATTRRALELSGQSQYHFDQYGASEETQSEIDKLRSEQAQVGIDNQAAYEAEAYSQPGKLAATVKEEADAITDPKKGAEMARQLASQFGQQTAGKMMFDRIRELGTTLTDIATDPALAYSLALMGGEGFQGASKAYAQMLKADQAKQAQRQVEQSNRRTVSQRISSIPRSHVFNIDGQQITWGDLLQEDPNLVKEMTDLYFKSPDAFNRVMSGFGLSGSLNLVRDQKTGLLGTPKVEQTEIQEWLSSFENEESRNLARLHYQQTGNAKLAEGDAFNRKSSDGRFGYDGVLDERTTITTRIKGERASSINQMMNAINNEQSFDDMLNLLENTEIASYITKAPSALSGLNPEVARGLHTLDRVLYQKLRAETGAAISFKEFQNNKNQYLPDIFANWVGSESYNKDKMIAAMQDSISSVYGFGGKLTHEALFFMKYGNQVSNFGSKDKIIDFPGSDNYAAGIYVQREDGTLLGPLQ